MMAPRERFISVDVETSGPIPGEFSLLTIGACDVQDDTKTFSCKLQPISMNADPEALRVTGLDLHQLQRDGLPPKAAMQALADWVSGLVGAQDTPVFVGLNAPFDWSFVNYYFHRFLGGNPFGHAALDIKAYFMGATGCSWTDARSSVMAKRLRPNSRPTHDALEDARFQAELFRLMRQASLNP